MITEFLKNNEQERQSQAALVEQEKIQEFQLMTETHLKQSQDRSKDTLGEL